MFSSRKRFTRPHGDMGRSNPELVSRQAQAATLAAVAFGSVDAARAFLNGEHEQLGGRPIDIAGASAGGLQQVTKLMTGIAAGPLSGEPCALGGPERPVVGDSGRLGAGVAG